MKAARDRVKGTYREPTVLSSTKKDILMKHLLSLLAILSLGFFVTGCDKPAPAPTAAPSTGAPAEKPEKAEPAQGEAKPEAAEKTEAEKPAEAKPADEIGRASC